MRPDALDEDDRDFPQCYWKRPGPPEYRPIPGLPPTLCRVSSAGTFWVNRVYGRRYRVNSPDWQRVRPRGPWKTVNFKVDGVWVARSLDLLRRAAFSPEELHEGWARRLGFAPHSRPEAPAKAPRLPCPVNPPPLPTDETKAEAPVLPTAVAEVGPDGRDPGVEYRPIPGFPGYEMGCDMSVWSRNRGRPWVRKVPAMRPGRGNPTVQLWKKNKCFQRRVRALYREIFKPVLPTRSPVPRPPITAKLDEAMVIEARRLKAEGWTYPALARRYGVGRVTIYYAVSGQTWSHVPMELAAAASPLPSPAPPR